jgi:hypothetical protein
MQYLPQQQLELVSDMIDRYDPPLLRITHGGSVEIRACSRVQFSAAFKRR